MRRAGDEADVVACSPAPPAIALQIFNQAIQPKMVVRFAQGEAMEATLAWAQSEREGYMRTEHSASRRRQIPGWHRFRGRRRSIGVYPIPPLAR